MIRFIPQDELSIKPKQETWTQRQTQIVMEIETFCGDGDVDWETVHYAALSYASFVFIPSADFGLLFGLYVQIKSESSWLNGGQCYGY